MLRIQSMVFGSLRLDLTNQQLWRDGQSLPLRPQAFAVLRYLAEHPHRLITAQELLREVWSGRYVSRSTIRGCIREIRLALQDGGEQAPYIETVGRRGYRFVDNQTAPTPWSAEASRSDEPLIVGRHRDLSQLQQRMQKAETGERQLILISGEAGMGKTSLAEIFIQQAGKDNRIRVGQGHCVDQFGQGNAYLPILDGLYDLVRTDTNNTVLTAMRRFAPSWLIYLPMFQSEAERDRRQQHLLTATQTSMFQELNHLLIELGHDRPLLLLLEDLHWCDTATLELLAYLAQRQEPARWLILGTCRPMEAMLQNSRLRDLWAELQLREGCWMLELGPLSHDDIDAYLRNRLQGGIAHETVLRLQRWSNGNALFLVNIVQYLLEHKLLRPSTEGRQLKAGEDTLQAVPKYIQPLILKQFENLPESAQQLLEVASVCGDTFATAALAAGLRENDTDAIDQRCAQLVHVGMLNAEPDPVTWPDGTVSSRLRYRHALHRQVIYEQMGWARRSRLHRTIAVRMEAGYGGRVNDIAGELALHFEKGQDIPRAVQYYQQAAITAAGCYASLEALVHSRSGLRLLSTLPRTVQNLIMELDLLVLRGTSKIFSEGYMAPKVNEIFIRAEQLCRQIDDRQRLVLILMVLRSVYFGRGNMQLSSQYVEQLLDLTRQQPTPLQLATAYLAAGNNALYQGNPAKAVDYLHQSSHQFNASVQREHVLTFGVDGAVICRTHLSRALRLLGYHDQAQQAIEAALCVAQELAHPFSVAQALRAAVEHYQFSDELDKMAHYIDDMLCHCEHFGLHYLATQARASQGWLLAKQSQPAEGTRQLEQEVAIMQAAGDRLRTPYCIGLQIDLYLSARRYAEARQILEQCLTEVLDNGLYIYHSELLRWRGELLLAETPDQISSAEKWFKDAIKVSHKQQAKALELRATVSLGRLWQSQGKHYQAKQAVKALYDQFSEGFTTTDMYRAKALLC